MRKIKNAKLAEAFMKFMTDMGATFIDVTPKKKPRKNYVSRSSRKPAK